MIIEIGIVAGEIWHVLDKNGETLLSQLKKSLSTRSADLILMSLGWLAREGHVTLIPINNNDYTIKLR